MDRRWCKSRTPFLPSRSRFPTLMAVETEYDELKYKADKQQWLNCEVKIFSFESEDDEEAKMVEVPAEGKIPRDATNAPTTDEITP